MQEGAPDRRKDMKTVEITLSGASITFPAARESADEIARRMMIEPFLISWFDGATGLGHPDVPECTAKPGWQAYGESRGGSLTIVVNRGRYVLMYTDTALKAHNLVPHDAAVCQDQEIQDLSGVDNHGECMQRPKDMRR